MSYIYGGRIQKAGDNATGNLARFRLNVDKLNNNTAYIKIGPINLANKIITGFSYKQKGDTEINQQVEYKYTNTVFISLIPYFSTTTNETAIASELVSLTGTDSITFQISGEYDGSEQKNFSLDDITITYVDKLTGALSSPVVSLTTGTYKGPQTAAISIPDDASSVRYTLDKSNPLTSSTAVELTQSATISIDTTCLMRAVAVSGDLHSAEVTRAYRIKRSIDNTPATAYTISEAIALRNDAQSYLEDPVYVKGIVSQKANKLNNNGTLSYYVSESGKTTDQQFEFHDNYKGENSQKWSAATDVNIGEYVIGYGKLSIYTQGTGADVYQLATGNYLIIHATDQQDLIAQTSDQTYWATFSNSSAVAFDGPAINVYTVNVNNDKLLLTEIADKKVPANTGVLIKSTMKDVYYSSISQVADLSSLNLLKPASETMAEDSNMHYYKLAYDDYSAETGLGFYYGAADGAPFTCKSGAAYLAVPMVSSVALHFSLSEMEEEPSVATELDNQNNQPSLDSGIKVLYNGQICIMRAGRVYDLLGREMSMRQ